MDLTRKLIPVFFVLILLANYFNFVGFNQVLRTVPSMEGRQLRRRVKVYFGIMHCLYLGVAILALVPSFWPLCTDEKIYPRVMNYASMLFIANYIFHFVLNCKKRKILERWTVKQSSMSMD